MQFRRVVIPLLLSSTHAAETSSGLLANPIRKVVTMLQAMQTKVEEEGVKEKDLYEKFKCYCQTGGSDLGSSISAAEDKIPSVGSDIESSEAKLAQSKQDLKQAQSERSAAKDSMKEATAVREKEAAEYASFKADADANAAAIAKAVTALEKGMGGSFLQTPAAQALSHAVEKVDLPEEDHQTIVSFLSNGYAPQSGEITGILKQMGDTVAANLGDETAAEEKAIEIYKALIAAKTKEVAATTATVESKTQQIGELGVAIVQMKEDLSDTQAALAEDQKFLENLKKSCATKDAEWEERSKTRADELVALADTIKVLNDDDALELFKKTLPSASFIQTQVASSSLQKEALGVIRQAAKTADSHDRVGLQLLALSLAGKRSSGGFDKVVKMIDEMVALLKKEQQDDNDKKGYCASQFDTTEDKTVALKRELGLTSNSIATAKETIDSLTEEIAALTAGIKALDKSVAEATEQRQEENTEYKDLIASDSAAKEVLNFAKNRLNKFYNPKLYKPAPKAELSRENRIYENLGGEIETTPAGGIAGTGVTVFAQIRSHSQKKAAPSPPPATWDAYAKKSGEGTGVIAMIDILIKDLTKEVTEAEAEEKNAQAAYLEMMKDAAAKRTTDAASLTEKTSAKADTESELQALSEHKSSKTKELMATEKYNASLHAECDWLMQYFDVRKQARADEVDSLTRAKAVLSGADYALVQQRSSRFLARA